MSNKPNVKPDKPLPAQQLAIQIFIKPDGSFTINHFTNVMASVKLLLAAVDALMTQKLQPIERPMIEVVNPLVDIPTGNMGRG